MRKHFHLSKKLLTLPIIIISSLLFGCSNKTPSNTVILKTALNTHINNFKLNINDSVKSNKDTNSFRGNINYQRTPFIMWVDLNQSDQPHVKMWIQNKNAYLNDPKEDNWLSTPLTNYTTVFHLKDVIGQMDMLPLSRKSQKLFKVTESRDGYKLKYSGHNARLWNDINKDNGLSTMAGYDDISKATIKNLKVVIYTSKKYKLLAFNISAKYKHKNNNGSTELKASKINKLKKLSVPKSVIENSVDISKIND